MSEIKIDVPGQLIEDTIRAEMIRTMASQNKEKLIEAVVAKAMSTKSDNYSSTPTHFQQAVNEMIRNEAKELFKEWIEENRKAIRDALLKYLNANKQKRLTELVEKLANNISAYGIHVNLVLKEDN